MDYATAAAAGHADGPVRLTIRDILALDLVATWGPEVVAGAANLDRPVRWLHVADPPTAPVARLRDEPELQAFIERELGPLFEHQQLLEVLRTYLRTGRNKSLAAQAHHVSPPAFYPRLRRIEALLGIDLEDWDHLTSLYVAILAYEAQRIR